MNADIAVQFDGVSKVFSADQSRNSVKALDDFTLMCAKGKTTCVLGPSGCGKTTLLRIAAGMEKPTSGSVAVGSGSTSLAMVTQGENLLPWRTVLDNVALGPEIQGVSRNERRKLALEAIKRVDLDSRAARSHPHELSGGMRQRAALARVLCAKADTLLLDEPLANIDEPTRHELQELLVSLAASENLTIIFVTHNIEEAVYLADHLVVMNHAKIADQIEVKLPRPRDRFSAEFVEIMQKVRGAMG